MSKFIKRMDIDNYIEETISEILNSFEERKAKINLCMSQIIKLQR